MDTLNHERRAELLASILEHLAILKRSRLRPFDAHIAERIGVLDRDALNALLFPLIIDGKIVLEPTEVPDGCGWVDGGPVRAVALAPAGTPSLEDRIVTAVTEAGIDGLGEEDLEDIVRHEIESDHGVDVARSLLASHVAARVAALLERGVLHGREHPVCGGETLTLAPAEWARRIEALSTEHARSTAGGFGAPGFLRDAIERLLAGTEA